MFDFKKNSSKIVIAVVTLLSASSFVMSSIALFGRPEMKPHHQDKPCNISCKGHECNKCDKNDDNMSKKGHMDMKPNGRHEDKRDSEHKDFKNDEKGENKPESKPLDDKHCQHHNCKEDGVEKENKSENAK